ncbi:MAG: TRAM domain-containing protein [Elusimicrobiota bacterium]|jgi:uncharacterized protein YacL|nr:TRAM domain-containing protein [Elusimicrobiota bacterium]
MFKKILEFFKKLFSEKQKKFLIDQSVLEDGRILAIVKTEFFDMNLFVPKFIIDEIRKSTSSKILLKRERAKRAAAVFEKLRGMSNVLTVINKDFAHMKDHYAKITAICAEKKLPIFTADFNLYRFALTKNVRVLTLEKVSKAFKPICLPGETINLFLMKEGTQLNQAVGYLDDGAIVIVEGAGKFIGKKVEIIITSVRQTPSQSMIFGKLSENFLQENSQSASANSHHHSHTNKYFLPSRKKNPVNDNALKS